MAGFVFNTPARIVCAAGASGQVGEQFRAAGVERVLVVTDAGVARAGGLAIVLEALRAAGVAHRVFQEVPRDPSEETVMAAAAAAVEMGAQGVLGLGGGSALDVAKLAALLATGHDALPEIYGTGLATGPRLPLILIPTLAGSGAEVTPLAVVVAGGEKKSVIASCLIADSALLDVDLTLTAPLAETAAAGAGAVALAVEAFTSANANANPLSQSLAEGGLGLLAWSLPLTVQDGTDRRARQALLSASLMVGQAFANAPVGAAHALAYPLCVRHGLPSGLATALLLPHVVRFNTPVAGHAYAGLLDRLFPEAPDVGDSAVRADAFAARLGRFLSLIGLPESLKEAGIPQTDLAGLAAAAQRQTRLLANNPRPLLAQDIIAIYKAAWG
ncbi:MULTISPECIES: iron-containing alcohol dehydrogenase [unclassified Xanthobacter]|uniref:iron-containing alcohol dehydrogenase n=1 Tax=unclassified Xanthobacter TaxID=2623496 RepID=UPI001F15904E|nr:MULTISPECIES: iron-containing alcohol dehydrogenase [unclassified Xanthobacter]